MALKHNSANVENSTVQAPFNSKGKKKRKHHQIRAGDWVCLLCNNLNFSFRNLCNRCRVQSKKQNFIQNL